MEKIFAEILDRAKAEADRTLRLANKVAAREVEYAERDAKELKERYSAENTRELLALQEKAAVQRERETKKAELAQRQEFVGKILEKALEIFQKEGRGAVFGESYRTWFKAQLKNAATCFNGKVKITCDQKDQALVLENWPLKEKPEIKEGKTAGGFIVCDEQERMTVDCTLEACFKNQEEKWRDVIIAGLFGKENKE